MRVARSLTVPTRYNGPPESGNGGYVAGRVAAGLADALRLPAVGPDAPWVEVTLRAPPPLDVAMSMTTDVAGGTATLRSGDHDVAQARLLGGAPDGVDPVEAVGPDEARAAEQGYVGLTVHPFPTCWVCGPDRPIGDGYRLRPGPVPSGRTACLWTVDASATADTRDGSTPPWAVWAALDCPGAWTALTTGREIVLGRMAAHVLDTPAVGEVCVVMGQRLRTDGRKTFTSTSIYRDDGRALGHAAATWIERVPAPG